MVAIWVFDRFARLVRQLYCNFYVRSNDGKGLHRTQSTVHYDEKADILRITMEVSKFFMRPGPGQHFFVYQPFRWRGWENHPFTLAYWEQAEQASASGTTQASKQSDTSPVTESSRSVADGLLHADVATGVNAGKGKKPSTYEFWARPRDGWTRQLRKQCLNSADRTCSPFLLIEGPYGELQPLRNYEKVLLIAGGSGIAAMVPYALDHARSKHSSQVHSLELLWVNRDKGYIESIAFKELSEVLAKQDVHPSFYATGSDALDANHDGLSKGKEVDDGDLNKDIAVRGVSSPLSDSSSSNSGVGVVIQHGRPDIRAEVRRIAEEARQSKSRLAIFACGPASMTDSARAAMAEVMAENRYAVDYFEESFGW